jgi:hypothetical protein
MGDVGKYVKLCREALAPIPCGRVIPQSCLGDSLSPKSDGPCLLLIRDPAVSSVSRLTPPLDGPASCDGSLWTRRLGGLSR